MNLIQAEAYQIFIETIHKEKIHNILIENHSKILIGVSGGSDSVFLFLCLWNYFNNLKFNPSEKIGIAHINYHLRGNDSNNDEEFVKNLSEKYNIPIYIKNITINSNSNLEEKCRNIRFEFFKQISNKNNYNVVALAHILEDRSENLIIKLLKGGSLKSIIQPTPITVIENIKYIRPLINLPKNIIIKNLDNINQKYRIDKTNFETNFFRNKVRNNILPLFDELNPQWRKSALKLFYSLQQDEEYLTNINNKLYNELSIKNDNDTYIIEINKLCELPDSIRNRIIIKAAKNISLYDTFINQDVLLFLTQKLYQIHNNKEISGKINLYKDNNIIIYTDYNYFIIKKNIEKIEYINNDIIINLEELNDKEKIIFYNNYDIKFKIINFDIYKDYKLNYCEKQYKLELYLLINKNNKFIRFTNVKDGKKIYIDKNKSKTINKILGDMKIPMENRKNSILIQNSYTNNFEDNYTKNVALIINRKEYKSRVNYYNYVNNHIEGNCIIRLEFIAKL